VKIISVQFDYPGSSRYDKLSRVLEYSIKKNCPGAEFKLIRIAAPTSWRTKKCFASNTVKLQRWVEEMEATDDDIIFLDCDMIVLRDLHDAFKMDFDVALTVNGTGSIPYNGGAVFCHNTQAARDFIRLWNKCNIELYNDMRKHLKWRTKYAGMNQAALGYMLETNAAKPHDMLSDTRKIKASESIVNIKRLPCSIWNVCKNDWRTMNDKMYILHVKSALRTAVLDPRANAMYFRAFSAAIKIWRRMAFEAGVIKTAEGNEQYELPQFLTSYKTRKSEARRRNKLALRAGRRRWHTRII